MARSERHSLWVSLTATAIVGVGALTWGIISGARVMVFDGVYTLAGVVFIWISMLASRTAASAPTEDFPFGRHAAVPLAVALQGAALIGTAVYGVVDAAIVLTDGGSETDAIDILPGLMPTIIRKVRILTGLPVLAGGLITEKQEVLQALDAGALAISSTAQEVWQM